MKYFLFLFLLVPTLVFAQDDSYGPPAPPAYDPYQDYGPGYSNPGAWDSSGTVDYGWDGTGEAPNESLFRNPDRSSDSFSGSNNGGAADDSFSGSNNGGGAFSGSNNGGSAREGNNNSGISIPNPLGDVSLIELFQIILNVIMVFAVPLIVFFIIYAGFLYVTARGNEQTISQAHKALLYAIIGGILILGANVLIAVIQGTVDSIR